MKTKPIQIDRSGAKWLPGAMALAATAASSQAATVQITLEGNRISTTGGDEFKADLTGDGTPDLARVGGFLNSDQVVLVWRDLYGNLMFAAASVIGNYYGASVGPSANAGNSPQSATHAYSILFSDGRINGGLATFAWLEVNAFNTGAESTVELTRLIFDDASTTAPSFGSIPGTATEWSPVPEPSGFAATSLLLGAAGLIRRRQARAA